MLPKVFEKLIEFFETLPGIGPKTAKRLAFYLFRFPQEKLEQFGNLIGNFKKQIRLCQKCFNLAEENLCSICQDQKRDKNLILVVEEVLDLWSIEGGKKYQGVYHVLHGRIDPLHYIGPEQLYIDPLLKRVNYQTKEIILATNPDMEGEATALYIKKKLEEIKNQKKFNFKISRLAYGLPHGADIEYADYFTLEEAIRNRREY